MIGTEGWARMLPIARQRWAARKLRTASQGIDETGDPYWPASTQEMLLERISDEGDIWDQLSGFSLAFCAKHGIP